MLALISDSINKTQYVVLIGSNLNHFVYLFVLIDLELTRFYDF